MAFSVAAAQAAEATLMRLSLDRLRARVGVSVVIFRDYLRFISLKAACSDFYAAALSPPTEVDDVWHAHLLDTLSYHEMCEAVVPGHFIHHDPDGGMDARRRNDRRRRALKNYEATWGRAPESWQLAEAGGGGAATAPALSAGGTGAGPSVRRGRDSDAEVNPPRQRRRLDPPPPPAPFHVRVQFLDGRSGSIPCRASDSVGEIKALLEERQGVPASQQRLIFAGKQLEDDRSLADYGIVSGSNLTMILALRGC